MLNKFYGVSLVALSLVMASGAASALDVEVTAKVLPGVVVTGDHQGDTKGENLLEAEFDDLSVTSPSQEASLELYVLNNTTGATLDFSGIKPMVGVETKAELPYAVSVSKDNTNYTSVSTGGTHTVDAPQANPSASYNTVYVKVFLAASDIQSAQADAYKGTFTVSAVSR